MRVPVRGAAVGAATLLLACAGSTSDRAGSDPPAPPVPLLATGTSTTAPPVVVSAGDTDGPVEPLVTGMHGGIRDSIPASLVDPLRIRAVNSRLGFMGTPRQDSLAARLARVGGVLNVYLSHYGLKDVQRNPDDPAAWREYRDGHLVPLVERARALRAAHGVRVHYDIWPEANVGGKLWALVTPERAGPRDARNFLRFWDRTVREVRAQDPEGFIVGPSLHRPAELTCMRRSPPPRGCRDNLPLGLGDVLRHARDAGTLPDIIGWHSFPSVWGYPGDHSVCDNDLEEELRDVRDTVEAVLGTADFPYEVSEVMGNPTTYLDPGCTVHQFASAERARTLGLRLASRGYFAAEDAENLAGLVRRQGKGWVPTPTWHLLADYAALEGERVLPAVRGDFDAYGARTEDELVLFVGNQGESAPLALEIRDIASLGWSAGDSLDISVRSYLPFRGNAPFGSPGDRRVRIGVTDPTRLGMLLPEPALASGQAVRLVLRRAP